MRLTSREREIADVLQKEPLISQDELAHHFGISRSSVAVHISNLMKKGIILGKGYVFNKKVSIVVVGQAYLEIKIRDNLDNKLIDLKYTGFAIEVCKALAGYGLNPKIITVVGNDDLGSNILNELKAVEVDISNIYRHPDKRTCKKIVSNKGFFLEEGYSEQEYHKAIDAREWVAVNCDWLIVEPDFQNIISMKMSSRGDKFPSLCGCWFANGEMPDFLNRYNLMVIGVPDFSNYDYYVQMGMELVQAETQNCIITDGSNNIVLINNQGQSDFPLPPNQSFNSKSALHLFLTGLVYGLSSGYPMRQAMRIASGTAHAAWEGQQSE